MALVAKHTLVADKVTVEAWVQIPPPCVENTQKKAVATAKYLGWYTKQKGVVAKEDT